MRFVIVFVVALAGAALAVDPQRREWEPEGLEAPTIECLQREQADLEQMAKEKRELEASIGRLQVKMSGELAMVTSHAVDRVKEHLAPGETLKLGPSLDPRWAGKIVWFSIAPPGSASR